MILPSGLGNFTSDSHAHKRQFGLLDLIDFLHVARVSKAYGLWVDGFNALKRIARQENA